MEGPSVKLTAKVIKTIKPDAGKSDQIIFDDDIPGLGIRIREGGSRNWVFQYSLGDKQRRMSLGKVIPETITEIREQAARHYAKVKLGQDPAGEKIEARVRAADTFETIAESFLRAKRSELRPRSYVQVEGHILKKAKPLHGLQVTAITRRDIATLLNALKESTGNVTANRTRASLSDFFGWSIREGITENNPVINTNKFEEKKRERVLKDWELRAIWNCLPANQYGAIVKLLMLTGQRASEIGDLEWSELVKVKLELPEGTIDLPPEGVIHLPAERCKNDRPHLVPLSGTAADIINARPRVAGRDCVFGVGQGGFQGWSDGKEALDRSLAEHLGEPVQPFVIHDLRRTVSTMLNGKLGIAPHVVEAVLNHVSGARAGVAGVYNRATYLNEKTQALNMWADLLMAIVEGRDSNVVQLRKA
jgi:integrase